MGNNLNLTATQEIRVAEKTGLMDWDHGEDPQENVQKKLENTPKAKSAKSQGHKKNMGRPTLFKADILKQAENMAGLGVTEEQMAKIWNVSVRTLAYWKKKNPEFLHAIRRGKTMVNLSMSQKLFKRGAIDGDVRAIKYWLNNRSPETWKSDRALINNQITNRAGADPVKNLDPKEREDILANIRETVLRNAGY